MSEAERFSGGCLCGAISLRVRGPVEFCGHCHCTMCQRAHGAGYVTWIAIPRAQFELEDPDGCLVEFASSDHGTRSFCGRCGASMLCASTKHPDAIDITLASLDVGDALPPQLHIHWDDRADWTRAEDELPRLGGETGMEPVKDD